MTTVSLTCLIIQSEIPAVYSENAPVQQIFLILFFYGIVIWLIATCNVKVSLVHVNVRYISKMYIAIFIMS